MNPITCSRPGHGAGTLESQMDRFLEDLVRGRHGALSGRTAWGPALDISETEDELRIQAEVPGIAPEEIEISIEGRTLTIRGEKKLEREDEGRGWRHVERRQGSFSRRISLPTTVDGAAVTAASSNGVLTVTLPKSKEARARRIEIQAG